MRKYPVIFLGILLILPFSSCQSSSQVSEDFQAIDATIQEALPETINADFSLPQYFGYQVSYTLNEASFTNQYTYASPFVDMDTKITYTISKGSASFQGEKSVRLLAADSGHNGYQLYLTLPTSLNNVTREDYTPASVVAKMIQNGSETIVHETANANLRGRGHSTWEASKKPYRLRFEKNTSIFGMPEAKNYVLLAEYADKSLLRNVFTHKLSSRLSNLPYTLKTRFVELYVNTTYLGVYVLTEQVEIHKNKLNIESIPGLADTGYFLELDMRLFDSAVEPGLEWINVRGFAYDIKDPNPDEVNYSQINADFIYEFLIAAENALINKEGYDDLIDIDAFIDFFLVQELTKNVDVGYSSVYLYREAGGKLKPGPLWDFDYAYGNAGYIDYSPENFYGMTAQKSRWFRLMMEVPEIRERFKDRYMDFYIHLFPSILTSLSTLADSITDIASTNFALWQLLPIHIPPAPSELTAIQTHVGQVNYVLDWLSERNEWIYQAIQQDDYQNGIF